jgi:hypothetical protein
MTDRDLLHYGVLAGALGISVAELLAQGAADAATRGLPVAAVPSLAVAASVVPVVPFAQWPKSTLPPRPKISGQRRTQHRGSTRAA